ncbi:MAG: hypothetical protein LW855_01735 [Alphaproteobacteria bacterium]|jgi:sec-independent protein translocase protein TatB|nr:hypothetical protein [Thalassospira sp.]MCE2964499.1 hypothetical protein [Alphaproteobacteria bacterium]
MFELAWSEIAIIAVAALIFLGPEDLAKTLFHLGRQWRKVQDVFAGFKADFNALGYEAEARSLREKNGLTKPETPLTIHHKPDDQQPPAS